MNAVFDRITHDVNKMSRRLEKEIARLGAYRPKRRRRSGDKMIAKRGRALLFLELMPAENEAYSIRYLMKGQGMVTETIPYTTLHGFMGRLLNNVLAAEKGA